MSKAEELLNSLTEEEISLYTANDYVEPHIVINDDRTITVPNELKKIAVQYDHNVETVTFDCPRYWDDLDMSKMAVYINIITPDSKTLAKVAKNVRVSENDSIMNFDWTITRDLTQVKGNLTFLICVKNTIADDVVNHWNSELCKDCYISEGLESDLQDIVEEYPDVITQILLNINTKLDKNQGAENNGKVLGINEDGNVIPVEMNSGLQISYNEEDKTLQFIVG